MPELPPPQAWLTRVRSFYSAHPIRAILTLTSVLLIISVSALKVQLFDPKITPDSKLFATYADNIRLNACISESDPSSGECEPSWGSQPPGYSLFLAAIRTVGTEPRMVIAVQVIIFTCAAFWLSFSVPYASSLQLFGRVVLLVASPLTMAWGRWILTETLAMATTMCAFAVFAKALREKRVKLPSLSAVLIIAMLIRWDQICLIFPAVALYGFLYPWREAFCRTLILISIVAIPYATLSGRALFHGLPAIPANTLDLDMPPNILRFWRVTALDQRATSKLIWPSWSREYEKVQELDFDSISAYVPKADLAQLIDRLSQTDPESDFPIDIDEEFRRLGTLVASEHPVHKHVGVPLARMVRIWTGPDKLFSSGWEGVSAWPDKWEVWRSTYRVLLLFISGLALLGKFGQYLQRLSILLFLYVIGRTGLLVSLTMLETRYLAETFPALEILAMLVLSSIVRSLAIGNIAHVSSTRSRYAILS